MALLERGLKRFVAICRISRSAERLKSSVLRTEILQICSTQGNLRPFARVVGKKCDDRITIHQLHEQQTHR